MHFLFAVVVLGGTSSLAIRLGRLRARLAAQKNELSEALALNRELATRDALTGLLNRRAMVELLAREHPRIVRGQGRWRWRGGAARHRLVQAHQRHPATAPATRCCGALPPH